MILPPKPPTEEAAIASPCIDICSMDEPTGFCRGCYRTRDEIASWPLLNNEEKRAILKQLDERKNHPPPLNPHAGRAT